MKEFMFFIRKQSNSKDTLSPKQLQQFLKRCEHYIRKLKNNGKLISAQPIEGMGKIVSSVNGAWKDVPFNETGEVIGGYYHILADDLDEAITIAKENPEFEFNPNTRIEIRPIKAREEDTGFVYPNL